MKPRRSITELLKAQVVELCCTVVCVRSLKSHLASACVAPARLALSTYASQDAFLRAPLTDMQRSTALAALVCKSSSLIVSYRSAMTWKPQQVKRPCYNVRDVDVTLTCDTHMNSAWYRPHFWWLKFHLLNRTENMLAKGSWNRNWTLAQFVGLGDTWRHTSTSQRSRG